MKKISFPLISLVVSIFFILSFVRILPIFDWLELKTIDWRFHWRGSEAITENVVIVSIDEKSVHEVGRWPWPRETIGDLISKLSQDNPKLIEMDVIFSESSVGDDSLVKSFKKAGNVILGYYFYQNKNELENAEILEEQSQKSFQTISTTALPFISDLETRLRKMVGLNANTPEISAAVSSQGYFNAFADPDGVMRRMPLMVSYRDATFPSMTLKTYSRWEGFDPVPIQNDSGQLAGLSVGDKMIPTNGRGEVLINYRGGLERFRVISAVDVLKGRVDLKQIENRVVLIGATAVGIYDLRVTPIAPVLPGVLIQANLLDNLIRGDFLIQDFGTNVGAFLWMIVITIVLYYVLPKLSIPWGMLLTLFLAGVYLWVCEIAFEKGLVIPMAIPLLQVINFASMHVVSRGLTEERQKKLIRTAFQAYLHPDLVKAMTENLDGLKLGGDKKECTILFSDVRNFTSISEKMEPEVLVDLMNNYFEPISKVIIDHGGYIDKFIGDAVMAIFGAPQHFDDHAYRACAASLEMKKVLNELEPKFREKYGIQAFRIGVGLHTGPVIVGNIGSKHRLNYTVMGDAVNLASRLESANKELGTEMCMSESTYKQVKDKIQGRFISAIHVKGKEEEVRVYEILSKN